MDECDCMYLGNWSGHAFENVGRSFAGSVRIEKVGQEWGCGVTKNMYAKNVLVMSEERRIMEVKEGYKHVGSLRKHKHLSWCSIRVRKINKNLLWWRPLPSDLWFFVFSGTYIVFVGLVPKLAIWRALCIHFGILGGSGTIPEHQGAQGFKERHFKGQALIFSWFWLDSRAPFWGSMRQKN